MTEDPQDRRAPPDPDATALDPADVASAGRSCAVLIVLLALLVLLLCVGVAWRWVVLQ